MILAADVHAANLYDGITAGYVIEELFQSTLQTMFEIEYFLFNSQNQDVATADEMALRYYLFLGGVTFKTGNKLISMDWDWIPLLDFAICLLIISVKLFESDPAEKEFEFTESDEKIIYRRRGTIVEIYTSFTDQIITTNLVDFQNTVRAFIRILFSGLIRKT